MRPTSTGLGNSAIVVVVVVARGLLYRAFLNCRLWWCSWHRLHPKPKMQGLPLLRQCSISRLGGGRIEIRPRQLDLKRLQARRLHLAFPRGMGPPHCRRRLRVRLGGKTCERGLVRRLALDAPL